MTISIEELYDRALALSSDVEDKFFELGRSLRQLLDRDPGLFQQIVKKSRLGRRKAYYLVEVSRKFEPPPIGRARLKKIGWTKLQIIGHHVTKDNVEELVSLAEQLKTKQLEREMQGKEPITDARCVLMYFTPKQYAEFEHALLKNGGKRSGRGIVGKEEALINTLRKAVPGLENVQPKRKAHHGLQMRNAFALGDGPYHFFDRSSRSAAASSICSASNFFSFAFSSSSCFSRLASETSMPPYLAFQLYSVASETPCLRARSAFVAPASCSFSTPMIRSSVNRARFICPSFRRPDSNSPWRKISVAGQVIRVQRS
jgi:hypothetical protein